MFGTIFGQWEFLKYRANCWSFGPAKTVVSLMLLLVVSGTGPPGYFEDWLFCTRSDVASKRLVSLVTKLIIFRQYHQTRVIKWVQQPFLIVSMTHHNLWCQCKRPCWFLYNSTQFQSVNIGVTSQHDIVTSVNAALFWCRCTKYPASRWNTSLPHPTPWQPVRQIVDIIGACRLMSHSPVYTGVPKVQ